MAFISSERCGFMTGAMVVADGGRRRDPILRLEGAEVLFETCFSPHLAHWGP